MLGSAVASPSLCESRKPEIGFAGLVVGAYAVIGPGPWYGLMQLHPHITRSRGHDAPIEAYYQTLNFVHLQIPVSGASRAGSGAVGGRIEDACSG